MIEIAIILALRIKKTWFTVVCKFALKKNNNKNKPLKRNGTESCEQKDYQV